MSDLSVIVNNIFLRAMLGGGAVLMGIVFLKVHQDRHKENFWGQIYRFGQKSETPRKAVFIVDKIYLILGVLSLVGGLMVLFYGFRPTLVG